MPVLIRCFYVKNNHIFELQILGQLFPSKLDPSWIDLKK